MAEMIGSAVIQESVSQIFTGLLHKYDLKEKSNSNETVERLEMAHIKLDAALEISNKWVISDPPLLRWRQKLKLAAQECGDALQKYKQLILEEEQMGQEVRTSSFPKRIAHATKTFLFSAFSSNDNLSLSRSIIRRFEWFADGASDFLRFVEIGGTPRCHIPFHSPVKHLLAGKELHHKIVTTNRCRLFIVSMVPFKTAEHGMEAGLLFIQKVGNAPENIFFLSVMLQISESTDIIGTTIKCLQMYTSHFKSTVENIKKELTQLPAQDFSWVPYVDSKEQWNTLHSFGTQWFRPNPLCCKRHDQHNICSTRLETSGVIPDASLEPVIEVNLQCQVSLSKDNKQRCPPYVKVGLLFTPHGSSKDILSADRGSPLTVIYAEEQHFLHTDIGFRQLGETILSKATDYFNNNTEAIVCQMLWMFKHGTAYVQVEKATMATKVTFGGARKRKLLQRQDTKIGSSTQEISHFLNLWAAFVPVRLRGLVTDWIQNQKESQS